MVIEAIVEGLGRFVRVTAPFDEALRELRGLGARAPLALGELATARAAAGIQSPLCAPGAFVAEAAVYRAGEPVLFVRSSPLLDEQAAARAANAHQASREIAFGRELEAGLYEQYLQQARQDLSLHPSQRRVLSVDRQAPYRIALAEFAANELTLWALGGADKAAAYAEFLRQNGRADSPVWLVDWLTEADEVIRCRTPYLRQLFFGGIASGSSFNAGRRLGFDDGAMGGVWGILKEL